MAKLTVNIVRKVAEQSQLVITDKELEIYSSQLGEVIDHIKNLDSLDTNKISLHTGLFNQVNVLREDEINPLDILTQDEVLSATENTHNGMFKVPAILKKDK